MLTKKDFKKIAEIINKCSYEGIVTIEGADEYQTLNIVETSFLIDDLIKWFKKDNPLFNEVKFREAVFK